jgi:exosortase E/protease (VPEID-CTERM system)
MPAVDHASMQSMPARWRYAAFVRLALLLLLLLTEFAFFSVRFDTGRVLHAHTPWTSLVTAGHLIIQFGVAILAAMLIFRGERLKHELARLATFTLDAPPPLLPLAGHFVLMLALYQLTRLLLEGGVLFAGFAGIWVAGWGCVAVGWLACWCAALAPLRFWRALRNGASLWLIVGSALAATLAVVAGQFADRLWMPLSRSTFWVVEKLLRIFYADMVVDADSLVVGTSRFSVQIAPQCSGYEGIGLVTVFLAIFLWIFRRRLRFPQSLLLLPIGCATIWIANAVRIALLVVVGVSISPDVAAGGFHTQAGWLAFNAVTLGLIAIAWNSPFFANEATCLATNTNEYRAAPYLVPFLALVGTAMLTKTFSSGATDAFYFFRVMTTAAALTYFWKTYRERHILQWSWSFYAVAAGIAAFGGWILIDRILGSTTDPVRAAQANNLVSMSKIMVIAWATLRIAGAVLIVPLTEELAFRGYLTRRLQVTDFEQAPLGSFSWFSFIASSVCFGALHGRWLAATFAGMAYALVLYRRGRLCDAVLAHATTNALILTQVFYLGDWSLWS